MFLHLFVQVALLSDVVVIKIGVRVLFKMVLRINHKPSQIYLAVHLLNLTTKLDHLSNSKELDLS